MAAIDGSLPSPDRQGFRRFFCLYKRTAHCADQSPLISFPPPATTAGGKSKAFASSSFRGLGCASSTASQAYPPTSAAAAVRSSADWEGKRHRKRRAKLKKKERRGQSLPSALGSASTDLWCAPGIAFVTGDDSVDCLVSSRDLVGRGVILGVDRVPRDRDSSERRGGNHKETSSMVDYISSLQASLFESHVMLPELYHHLRGYDYRPTVEFEEENERVEEYNACKIKENLVHLLTKEVPSLWKETIAREAHSMLFQHRTLLQGRDAYDRYRDWRLDVDNMTYEELLELGDKIGHVSTGLGEEEVACSIRKVKHSIFFDMRFSSEMDSKCSICQEEYQMDDEVGKLRCGHGYHMHCIKKWLLQKNMCPICKTIAKKPSF